MNDDAHLVRMISDDIIGLLAGAGVVAVVLFLGPRSVSATTRAARWQLSATTVVLICLGIYLSFNAPVWALAGAVIILFAKITFSWHQKQKINYVAEEPLLGEAVSPELAVQLENLGAQFRNQKKTEAPDETLGESTEIPPQLY